MAKVKVKRFKADERGTKMDPNLDRTEEVSRAIGLVMQAAGQVLVSLAARCDADELKLDLDAIEDALAQARAANGLVSYREIGVAGLHAALDATGKECDPKAGVCIRVAERALAILENAEEIPSEKCERCS